MESYREEGYTADGWRTTGARSQPSSSPPTPAAAPRPRRRQQLLPTAQLVPTGSDLRPDHPSLPPSPCSRSCVSQNSSGGAAPSPAGQLHLSALAAPAPAGLHASALASGSRPCISELTPPAAVQPGSSPLIQAAAQSLQVHPNPGTPSSVPHEHCRSIPNTARPFTVTAHRRKIPLRLIQATSFTAVQHLLHPTQSPVALHRVPQPTVGVPLHLRYISLSPSAGVARTSRRRRAPSRKF